VHKINTELALCHPIHSHTEENPLEHHSRQEGMCECPHLLSQNLDIVLEILKQELLIRGKEFGNKLLNFYCLIY
jgi:hypothetical protein